MTEHKDRNDGYIPDTPEYTKELRPIFDTVIGRQFIQTVPVVHALADDFNRQPPTWQWAQVNSGNDGQPEHWSLFRGWDVRIGVELNTWNRREVNDWKGRDEIRKEGEWKLLFNDQIVFGDYISNDVLETLLVIRSTIKSLFNLPIDWRTNVDYRTLIEGRRVYYKGVPAVFGHWMPDQGNIMIKAVEGLEFPPSAYDIDQKTGTEDNPEYNYSDEFKHESKDTILSPHIWWWRDRLVFGEEKNE